MKARAALWLATIGLIAACNTDSNPSGPRVINDEGGGGNGFSLSGTIYGLSAGPDSQRVALSGATVTVVRLADITPDTSIVDPDSNGTNPDTIVVPPPDTIVVPDSVSCPVTWLCARQGGRMAFTLDTVFPPPSSCFDTADVITATTDASGSFTLEGLGDGVYGVKVEPASGSGYRGFSYCGGIVLTEDRPDPLDFYLSAAP